MRRFLIFMLAALLLLSSLAIAEPANGGTDPLPPVTIPGVEGNAALPTETQMPEVVPALQFTDSEPTEAPLPTGTPQPALSVPDPDDASLPVGPLLDGILEILEARDYTLTYEDVRSGTSDVLILHRLDDRQLEITLLPAYGNLMRIVADAEGCTVYSGDVAEYSYGELLEALFSSTGLNAAVNGALQSDLSFLDSLVEADDFLRQALMIALEELSNAGLDFRAVETSEGSYLNLSLSPRRLIYAAVRFVDRILEYEDEMDALLERYDAPLRMLFPDLYEIYNPSTGQYVQRVAYSCAELKEAWWAARQQLLSQQTGDAGADLQFYLSDYGTSRLNLSLRNVIDDASATLLLDFDEMGNGSGTLSLSYEDYDYMNSRYTSNSLVLDVQLSILDDAAMLRVLPRTPVEGFSGLTANLVAGYDALMLDVVTDLLQLHFSADELGVNGSLNLSDDLIADLHLSVAEDYVHGSLILSEGRYSYVLRLNE